MNRIITAIEQQKANIRQRLAIGATDQTALDKLHAALNMTLPEFARFQELKSALMGIYITTAEAITIYRFLGTTPESFNAQPLEVKVVLTRVFKELLDKIIK